MIEIRIEHEADIPSAIVDPNQLELAILNLSVNARDAMPDGGHLTIGIRKQAVRAGEVAMLPAGDYVRLSVIDEGCGMSNDTLARAIEPFYSTKEIGRGTGLGLSMVHGLAAQMGGGFAISSELGKGTSVDLFLPIATGDATEAVAPAAGEAGTELQPLSVLLVDDEDLVRFATADMVRDLGHRVVEVGSGAEALDYLREGLEVDAVITDYKMPRMDGAELARQIGEIDKSIRVLIITGYTGISDKDLNLPRLAKPFGQAEIAAALTNLFNRDDKVIRFPTRSPK